VHVPTDHEVDELLDVRDLLEAETARLAARSADAEAVGRLRAIWRHTEKTRSAHHPTASPARE
jgi:DNA-binding FadR family transcriptional regulator